MSGLADFARGAGRVGSTLAEVGLPLVGLAAEGQAGMAAGNQLASLVPGTEQHKQRQFQINQQADARAQQTASAAMRGAESMFMDDVQQARLENGLGQDDASTAALIKSQDGQQAIGIMAMNALLSRGSSLDLEGVKAIAKRAFGADFDPEKMTFRYRGQEYEVGEEMMLALQEGALRKSVDHVILDGIHLAAKQNYQANLESTIASAFEAQGVSKSQALAGTRDMIGSLPRGQVDLWRIAEGYGQLAQDEQAQNIPGFEDKSDRMLAELEAQNGIDIVGNPEEQPLSAVQLYIEEGSAAAQMLGKSGTVFASEFAEKVRGSINLGARIRQYKESVLDPATAIEESKRQYYDDARDGTMPSEFIDYLNSQEGNAPGITFDDVSGQYEMNDSFYVEYSRWREHERRSQGPPPPPGVVEIQSKTPEWMIDSSGASVFDENQAKLEARGSGRRHVPEKTDHVAVQNRKDMERAVLMRRDDKMAEWRKENPRTGKRASPARRELELKMLDKFEADARKELEVIQENFVPTPSQSRTRQR